MMATISIANIFEEVNAYIPGFRRPLLIEAFILLLSLSLLLLLLLLLLCLIIKEENMGGMDVFVTFTQVVS